MSLGDHVSERIVVPCHILRYRLDLRPVEDVPPLSDLHEQNVEIAFPGLLDHLGGLLRCPNPFMPCVDPQTPHLRCRDRYRNGHEHDQEQQVDSKPSSVIRVTAMSLVDGWCHRWPPHVVLLVMPEGPTRVREQLALGIIAFRKLLAEALRERKANYAVSLACRQYIQTPAGPSTLYSKRRSRYGL